MFVQSKVNESLKIRIGNINGNTYFMGEKSKPKVLIFTAGSTGSMNVFEGNNLPHFYQIMKVT